MSKRLISLHRRFGEEAADERRKLVMDSGTDQDLALIGGETIDSVAADPPRL